MPDPRTRRALLEICVDDPEHASVAMRAGADRVELCAQLEHGGLSPAPGDWDLLREANAATLSAGSLVCMVRPRPGDFVLRRGELEGMRHEVAAWRERGAAGVVLGVLARGGGVDENALRALVDSAGEMDVVFHRAFDEAGDSERALEVLADAGVARVLTTGGAATAWEGRAALAGLVERSAGRVTVLAGGGVRSVHARELVQQSGAREVHSSARMAGVFDELEVEALARAVDPDQ